MTNQVHFIVTRVYTSDPYCAKYTLQLITTFIGNVIKKALWITEIWLFHLVTIYAPLWLGLWLSLPPWLVFRAPVSRHLEILVQFAGFVCACAGFLLTCTVTQWHLQKISEQTNIFKGNIRSKLHCFFSANTVYIYF